MLELALAIALGIVIGVLVLRNLPRLLEGVAWIVLVLIAGAVALLVFPAGVRAVSTSYSALGGFGPWVVLLLGFVMWGYPTYRTGRQIAQLLASPPEAVRNVKPGWALSSLVLSFVVMLPIAIFEDATDPGVAGADPPNVTGAAAAAPALVSYFMLLAMSAVVAVQLCRSWRLSRKQRPSAP